MSSFKNAIPRRVHKERAQPSSRRKFGLLEKHKDYVVRAQAFHRKEEILRKLKEKAALRNPDEFYFKMIRSKIVDGVHTPKFQMNQKNFEKRHPIDNQSSNNHIYFPDHGFDFHSNNSPYVANCNVFSGFSLLI